MNSSEIIQGVLSVEIRGLVFFALALGVLFFLRKRSASVVASCWRSVFVAATVMIAIGFSKPMLVMELVGSNASQSKEKVNALTTSQLRIEKTAVIEGGSAASLNQATLVSGSQSDAKKGINGAVRMSGKSIILTIWMSGVTVLLMRSLAGIVGLARLRRQSHCGGATLIEKFRKGCESSGIGGLRLRTLSADGGVPFVAGVLRPILYVPKSASEWDSAEWEIVLRHEVAHVRHFDGFFNLLAQLCLAVYWMNPLAWIAYRQLKMSQECAADDSVLCAGVSSNDYAGTLLRFCSKSASLPAMVTPMARPSSMRMRIERILDAGRRRTPDRTESRSGGVAIVLLAAVLGTTVFVHAEKVTNQVLMRWTLEHFVEAITEPQSVAKEQQILVVPGDGGSLERYNRWGGTFSLNLLERLLENDLYLSGPHKNGVFNVRSKTSFGHYNPAALEEMTQVLAEVLAEKSFVDEFQPAYDEHLRDPIRIYLDVFQKVHQGINEDPEGFEQLRTDYIEWVAAGQVDELRASLGREFNKPIADSISDWRISPVNDDAPKWYEAALAAKFWTRRILAGTDEEFMRALREIMVVMDPEGLQP